MNLRSRKDPWLRTAAIVLLTVLLFGHVATSPSSANDDAPMRTEDVVRMLVRGVPVEEILVSIRTRPALFDVSPDMQEELRLAGVTDELIQAMIDRMAELNPSPEPPTETVEEPQAVTESTPALRIWLDPQREDGKPSILRLRGVIDLRLREAWQLDAATEGSSFEDLALYMVCRTPTHVPDHWRSKSPLGRDFVSMPRHRMLVFLTAGEEERGTAEGGPLELELPPHLEVDLSQGEAHDLSLGIAIQAAGRYLRWTDDRWDELTLDPAGTEIRADVRAGRDGQLTKLEVQFNRNPSSTAAE